LKFRLRNLSKTNTAILGSSYHIENSYGRNRWLKNARKLIVNGLRDAEMQRRSEQVQNSCLFY